MAINKLLSVFLLLSISLSAVASNIDLLENSASDEQIVESIWADHLDQNLMPLQFFSLLSNIDLTKISTRNKLRLFKIQDKLENQKSIFKVNLEEELSSLDALKLASDWIFISEYIGDVSLVNLNKINAAKAKIKSLSEFEAKTIKELKDLFFNGPDFAHYNNGEYKDSLKVFLFCRHDRHYPCLFVMKDIFNNTVRNADQSLWTLPGLAHSRRELPYNITNGYTPSGVHTIDSVMPEANRQTAFGKFRRMMLDWVDKNDDEENTKSFLPKSAYDKTWWKEASLARDIGRQYLRIHGTGNRNEDSNSHFYPHYATSGCISTREGKYDGVDYKDQRVILDKMMNSMQMAPIFSNEVNLKGVLYVIELDDQKKKVTAEDLKDFDLL